MVEEEVRCTIVHLAPTKIQTHTEIKASTHTDADEPLICLNFMIKFISVVISLRNKACSHHELKGRDT